MNEAIKIKKSFPGVYKGQILERRCENIGDDTVCYYQAGVGTRISLRPDEIDPEYFEEGKVKHDKTTKVTWNSGGKEEVMHTIIHSV